MTSPVERKEGIAAAAQRRGPRRRWGRLGLALTLIPAGVAAAICAAETLFYCLIVAALILPILPAALRDPAPEARRRGRRRAWAF